MDANALVTLIHVKARAYDFMGQKGEQVKGISYKATLSGTEGVFIVKTNEGVYKDLQNGEVKNQEGMATLQIRTDEKTGVISLYLERFDYSAENTK